MSSVILGGGIIGSSIAYYLSQNQPSDEIHVVEASSQLFSAASGYAAGFLAKDWFAPALAPLAALSFDLHESLAAEHGGDKKWGYMKGTALSLDVSDGKKKGGARGDDWLRAGTSRAETAAGSKSPIYHEAPGWMTKQKKGVFEKISEDDTVAQADPLRLSKFFMETALSRGVNLHHPAKAVSLVTDGASNTITGVRIIDLTTRTESTLPCTNLIICAGPWTPQVFCDLFPSSSVSVPITPLAGYSLVVRSPRYTLEHEAKGYGGRSHAVFTTHPASSGFSPEIFSREGGEIYIAGLNSTQIPLPSQAEDSHKLMEQKEMERLRQVAIRLMGKLVDGSAESTEEVINTNDLEIVREGLCFRPVSARGVPFVAKVEDDLLGGFKTGTQNKKAAGRARGGVFVATGHGPWGISLAPGTGRVVAQMVEGLRPEVDISGLAVGDSTKAKL
ncbi:NAD(P)/FAD-dependent oxidoreductase [Aspergillus clavatus NRRL 1]|uniref:FAD dependent oxidoreductase superfamily n=1 Tax=Aspergillus clavatus (strain ATCC 1007 / CBS 513.65 / DSM 816 / NCTC 3887 / NRRL 1 / QM 1276 / 107) TaxID=344612 RepID=A1CCH4_ASPCL|nr:FAD dependent oxidoreductase superfamily [Aspergillus clavatus NRRL 1]EAW12231.1 FAD dependent oxidoreductase superfamily [Aspergillus clavatus NRRL 1]